eukprot:5792000-Karenia_brevis.AAC.1
MKCVFKCFLEEADMERTKKEKAMDNVTRNYAEPWIICTKQGKMLAHLTWAEDAKTAKICIHERHYQF